MITKILPIVLLASIFYIGSIYSSRNLGKKLEKRSQTFNDPVIDNYLKAFPINTRFKQIKSICTKRETSQWFGNTRWQYLHNTGLYQSV